MQSARSELNECRYGMENTYQTAQPVLPGILKCATDAPGLTEGNRLCIETMGIVQKETGLPIFAHNAHRQKTAPDQLTLLERMGADPHKIIIGHASDTQDIPYLVSLLKRGVWLGFDRLNGTQIQADTIYRLLDKGYSDKLLLSRDGGAFVDFGDQKFTPTVQQTPIRTCWGLSARYCAAAAFPTQSCI